MHKDNNNKKQTNQQSKAKNKI